MKVGDELAFCEQKVNSKREVTLTSKKGIIEKFRTVRQALVRVRNKTKWVDLEEVEDKK